MIRRFFRHLWQSIKNIKRNGWMSIAAITSVAITLTLVGIFAAFLLNTEKLASGIEKNVQINTYLQVDSKDNVKSYVDPNDSNKKINNPDYHKVYDQIKKIKNVKKITFSSKDEQLEKLKKTMGDDWTLFDGDSNPLYDVYIVQTTSPRKVKSVAKAIDKISGVDSVAYGGTDTDRIFGLANFVRTWGLVGTGLLVLVAIFLISNTIRITILSRRNEIQIMRLVGAKNGYIRMPFFFEGAWVGLIGAIVPSLIVGYLYQFVFEQFNPNLATQNLSLYEPNPFVFYLIGAMFVIGIIIGSLGSVLSMRRFLKI
ncbi:permease-like cell division protein FtsX [Streptococcus caviae]|uniref:permease-like cell division protein FtsX n=1 Tax=Streptococcus sp. 'caviae' TaxID=1915004 RepID=UPI00094BC01C|nr:permease-like cell division protein FtsX [Streptococcus sp. 'caviae']OLN82832.1 cell division protein FtsX [Streptococcus sp. 'caviae']